MLLFLFSSQPPTETLRPETGPVWGEGALGLRLCEQRAHGVGGPGLLGLTVQGGDRGLETWFL